VTPLTSEGHVPTPDAAQYLEAVCRQLQQRAQERPERAIRVALEALTREHLPMIRALAQRLNGVVDGG
jgi:hypothetical protein